MQFFDESYDSDSSNEYEEIDDDFYNEEEKISKVPFSQMNENEENKECDLNQIEDTCDNLEIYDDDIFEFRRMHLLIPESHKYYSRYGPCNPFKKNIFSNSITRKCKYSPNGICHMLSCQCHTVENETETEDDDKVDWFTNSCQMCEKEISLRSLAYRLPNINGGFEGCYCSHHCRNEQFDKNNTEFDLYFIQIRILDMLSYKFPIDHKEANPNYRPDMVKKEIEIDHHEKLNFSEIQDIDSFIDSFTYDCEF